MVLDGFTPVWITLSVGAAATILTLPAGIAVAWYLERTRRPARGLLQTLVMLPLVMPPVVTGYLLLWIFSPRSVMGRALDTLGAPVAFHWLGAVVAAAVVGFPLLVIQICLALKSIDLRLETVSLSLGRGPWDTFRRVTLPLAWPGILAGAILAFARGLGEFGATIILAGRIPGETETISLAIYAALDNPTGEKTAAAFAALSVAFALVCVCLHRVLDARHRQRLELES